MKWGKQLSNVNYLCGKFHSACLTGFCIRLCLEIIHKKERLDDMVIQAFWPTGFYHVCKHEALSGLAVTCLDN